MIVASIKARRPHSLPHRQMAAGETLCLMQFSSEEDFKFFANHLRWSAFAVERAAEPEPAPQASSEPTTAVVLEVERAAEPVAAPKGKRKG